MGAVDDLEGDASGGGGANGCGGGASRSDGCGDGGLAVLVGSGPFVQLYRVDVTALLCGAASGAGAGNGPGPAAEPIGTLVQQAAHAHDVTSVLCVGGRWFSASHDGSVLHAPLMPPHPTAASA